MMRRSLMALALGFVLMGSTGTWAAESPTAVMTKVVAQARQGNVAAVLPYLSPVSQQALVDTWSHSSGLSESDAYQTLAHDDPDAVAFFGQVVQAMNLGPVSPVTETSVSDKTVVRVNGRAYGVVDHGGPKIALLEAVLPTWLHVAPATPPVQSDDEVVVVGEPCAFSEMDAMSDAGIPTPPPPDCNPGPIIAEAML